MNSHRDIRRRLSAYCGGELEFAERQLVERHLAECPACRTELADLQTTLRLISSTPEVDPPPWMTARIMARIRGQQTEKRSWLQHFFFPLHIKLPLEAIALLMVCISGYYMTRTVETNLEQARQQQLQEIPAQPAPPPTPQGAQPPDGSEKQKRDIEPRLQKDTTQTVAPETVQQPDYRLSPATPITPPGYAPIPPAYRDQYGGKAESSNSTQEVAPEMKLKSRRGAERQSDAAAPAAAGRIVDTPAGLALPQAVVVLNVNDPTAAPALIREALLRSGGEILEERDPTARRLKVRITPDRIHELLTRLERLGRITERPVTPPAGAQLLELTVQW
jgi:hypothetical protein